MKNWRKAQLQLAVLLAVTEKEKRNGVICTDAEKRLEPDDRYNEMMLNGKQTKGRKELQFIIFNYKEDHIIKTVRRGVFKENDYTYNERMEKLIEIVEALKSGEIKDDGLLLSKKTVKECKDIYKDNPDWSLVLQEIHRKDQERRKRQ